ncbi:hypothetical protein PSP6_440078 [Paraburkholderia tropica]|nr:hypothetical protein PSP6_440078 [Paraburkholderia tropica]
MACEAKYGWVLGLLFAYRESVRKIFVAKKPISPRLLIEYGHAICMCQRFAFIICVAQ